MFDGPSVTVIKIASSNEGLYVLLSGVLGALIGVASTYFTLRTQRKYELDKRYFEARKEAYTKALAIFTFALIERDKKRVRVTAEAAALAVGEELHTVMGQLNLFSSVTLTAKVRALFRRFDMLPPPIPKPDPDFDQIKLDWQNILDQMRQELGMEPYLLSREVRDSLTNPTNKVGGNLKNKIKEFFTIFLIHKIGLVTE